MSNTSDFNETPGNSRYRRPNKASSLSQMWQNPIVKLVIVLMVLGGAALAGMKFLSGGRDEQETVLATPGSGGGAAKVGNQITPEYQLAVQQSDIRNAAEARATGDTAVPTPLQTAVSSPEVDTDMNAAQGEDPIRQFEAILQKDGQGKKSNLPPPQTTQPAVQVPPEVLKQLTEAMANQIGAMMKTWTPPTMSQVTSNIKEEDILMRNTPKEISVDSLKPLTESKPVVTAGSVYYGQMIIEANSDIPGPIMAQILTGPLAGGRAIGQFQTFRNHLLIRFDTVSLGTNQMSVDIIALDPNTTLGGIASEVDPRYFQRVLLPAAAAFISEYGQALSEPTSTVSVSGTDGTNISTSTNERDAKDAMYAGIGAASEKIEQFVTEEASSIKRLVRVGVGTPIGMFFVKPVCGFSGQCNAGSAVTPASSPSPSPVSVSGVVSPTSTSYIQR